MRKRKVITISACLLCLLLCAGLLFWDLEQSELQDRASKQQEAFAHSWDVSWYNEALDEYVISSKEQLYGFADLSQSTDFAGKTIKLGGDIVVNEGEASEWEKEAPELEWMAIRQFAGMFDGQGYTISGLYGRTSTEALGMFATTGQSCVIKNLQIKNSYFQGKTKEGIGGIVGNGSGTFEKIYCDTIIDGFGYRCGGIIGTAQDGTHISECWYAGNVIAKGDSGGIIGCFAGGAGSLRHSLNNAEVTTNSRRLSGAATGGLIGLCKGNVELEDNLNAGYISSEHNEKLVGAVCGQIEDGTLTLISTWAVKENAQAAIGSSEDGSVTGICNFRSYSQMKDYGGYQYTDLNFNDYWTVAHKKTPILRCFASEIPDISDLERICVADKTWFDGTKTEYTITTAEQLLGLSSLADDGETFESITVRLGADIQFNSEDAAGYEAEEPLNIWIPVKTFAGTFDGQGHTISGLYAVSRSKDNIGLFARTTATAEIRNLKVTNSYFATEKGYLGGIVAVGCGKLTNIYTNIFLGKNAVSETEHGTGGMVGSVGSDVNEDIGLNEGYDMVIMNCWSDCYIRSTDRFNGGILGSSACLPGREVKVEHCLFTGTLMLEFEDSDTHKVSGGIIGKTGNRDSEGSYLITDCLNAGTIVAGQKATSCGGIVGYGGGNSDVKCTIVTTSYSIRRNNNDPNCIVADAKGATVTDCDCLSSEELTGEYVQYSTKLNFTDYWEVTPDNLPVLKIFSR